MNNTPTPKTDAMASMLRTRKEWQSHGEDLERELADAREQRDRLASTLETIRFNAVDDDIRLLSDQALAAVKGVSHE
jgi:hypothetical protein